MKFCKDCRHFTPPLYATEGTSDYYQHARCARTFGYRIIDLVAGDRAVEARFCSNERVDGSNPDRCGMAGKFFEPRVAVAA